VSPSYLDNPRMRHALALSTEVGLNVFAGIGGCAVSVIITAENRASYLDLLLESLRRQTLRVGAWEAVVAYSCAQDGIITTLKRHEREAHIQIRRCPVDGDASRAIRLNRAVGDAQGRALLFLPDYCLLAPDCLLAHIYETWAAGAGGAVILGRNDLYLNTHLFAPDEIDQAGTPPRRM